MIYSVNEMADATGTFAFTFAPISGFTHEYTRQWLVETDRFDGALEVAASIPVTLRDFYAIVVESVQIEFDAFAFCDSIVATRTALATDDTERSMWVVDAHYGPMNLDFNNENPLLNKAIVRWSGVQFEEIVDIDVNGAPITASNLLAYDPAVTRDQSRPQLTIEVNTSEFDPFVAFSYVDTINLDTFANSDPGTVKVASVDGEQLFSPVIGSYWKTTWVFQFDRRGWQKSLLDAGYMELDPTSPTGYRLILIDGSVPSTPVPLNGQGQQLLPADLQATGGIIGLFDIYESVLFSAFGFGDLFV